LNRRILSKLEEKFNMKIIILPSAQVKNQIYLSKEPAFDIRPTKGYPNPVYFTDPLRTEFSENDPTNRMAYAIEEADRKKSYDGYVPIVLSNDHFQLVVSNTKYMHNFNESQPLGVYTISEQDIDVIGSGDFADFDIKTYNPTALTYKPASKLEYKRLKLQELTGMDILYNNFIQSLNNKQLFRIRENDVNNLRISIKLLIKRYEKTKEFNTIDKLKEKSDEDVYVGGNGKSRHSYLEKYKKWKIKYIELKKQVDEKKHF
jgi:hypothetical protein